jgi:hypothetical protein
MASAVAKFPPMEIFALCGRAKFRPEFGTLGCKQKILVRLLGTRRKKVFLFSFIISSNYIIIYGIWI